MSTEITVTEAYFVRGQGMKHWNRKYEVKDPPCSGHTRVLTMRSDKRTTWLCPVTLLGGQVSATAGEFDGTESELTEEAVTRVVERLQASWRKLCALGQHRDYDTAALFLHRLGGEVPTERPASADGEASERPAAGKEAATAVLKLVNRKSKRGRVAAFFMEGPRSVLEAMAEFDMSRNSVLSALYMLRKDHGLGYSIKGDLAELEVPKGAKVFDD